MLPAPLPIDYVRHVDRGVRVRRAAVRSGEVRARRRRPGRPGPS